jgi:hypothetical protein
MEPNPYEAPKVDDPQVVNQDLPEQIAPRLPVAEVLVIIATIVMTIVLPWLIGR